MKILPLKAGLVLAFALVACSSGSSPPDSGVDLDAGQVDGDDDPDGDGPADGDMTDGGDQGPVELNLTAVLPSRGPVVGGTWTNIIGSGFVNGIAESPFDVRDVTDVWFGDNSAIDIEVIRDDMISVRTPPGVAGLTEVIVENPNGRLSLADAFDYFETVRVDSLEPTDFTTLGGTPFLVTGTGFTPDTTILVADHPASNVQVDSRTEVRAVAPPGVSGAADVELVNRNGNVFLFREALYHPPPNLEQVDPPAGPQAGGTSVTIYGDGFEPGLEVSFGAQQAIDLEIVNPTSITASTPAGSPGPVDVTVQGVLENDLLPGGFVFLSPTTGSLQLEGVSLSAGPTLGGQTVYLAGEGFSEPVTAVRFGGQLASDLLIVNDRLIQITVPPGPVGSVSVEAETGTDLATLADGYRYFEALQIDGVTPVEGPAVGGIQVSMTGQGFGPQTQVLLGGVMATAIVPGSSTEITFDLPPGPVGSVDVIVRDSDSSARLEAGFQYTGELELNRVDPDFGSQAGGTFVLLYGDGFDDDMRITFGGAEASLVQVSSPSVASVRTPPGIPGEVTVTVEVDDRVVDLPAGYSYIDPTNDRGGASGGPISGSVNVTVLDGSWANYGAPVPDATVLIAAPALSGSTDLRGQVTFSGPSLVREVTITIVKEGYEAITVASLNASNLTVYMYPNEQDPIDTPPIEVTYGSIQGRVFGFKDIPGLPTGPGITQEARVNFTSYSIYSVPPYGGVPSGSVIAEDGASYEYTVRLGNYSLYSLFGAFDSATNQFTPALLGVRRGVQVVDEEPLTGQDLVLSTPLDQSVVIHLDTPPLGLGETPPEYSAYVSLDLGHDGIIYLNQTQGTTANLVLEGLPEATADSFLFVGLASNGGTYPYSYTFRRQAGELAGGVDMGPFLGFTEFTEPPITNEDTGERELIGGRIAWTFQGPTPEVTLLLVQTDELLPRTLWMVVLPGEVSEVTLPEELLGILPQGERMLLLLYTADSPRFEFDRFNYGQLSTYRWTSYTVNFGVLTTP